MGPIFQQIIDKVKSKAEVIHVKKSILINRLISDNTNVYTVVTKIIFYLWNRFIMS